MSMITKLLINNTSLCVPSSSLVAPSSTFKCKYDGGRCKCVVEKDQSLPQEMFQCYVDECEKVAHASCYVHLVESEKYSALLVHNALDGSVIHPIVCGKACYRKFVNTQKDAEKEKKRNQSLWTKDGPDDTVSSMSVLIEWLTEEENYNNYRGGSVNGSTTGDSKMAICEQIRQIIRNKGKIEPSCWHTLIYIILTIS